ncbi:MAG: 6-phosphogluconolactonase [Nitrospirae bacterium]|nr:6-phosphogluconolactonase [Nitrospirota bacterium]
MHNTTRIHVLPDLEAASHQAALTFVELARERIGKSGRFTVALSGGTTPMRLYALLASEEYARLVDWESVLFYWADERCVPPESQDSNFGNAYRAMLSKLPVPHAGIHWIFGEAVPDEAARLYDDELRQGFGGMPVFDLVLLGMGEDGHTASLFPGSDALAETERYAVSVDREPGRVTLTLPVINAARNVVFLVSGAGKADVVARILGGGPDRQAYPAGLVQPADGRLVWLLDTGAASKIEGD